jgi:sulfatase modifying factor 1
MHKNDIYILKLNELKSCLKNHIYTENEILNKISNLETWAQVNGLSIERFDREKILMIAKEMQRLYQVLWDSTNQEDWLPLYQSMRYITQDLYSEDEVFNDWQSRLQSKAQYETLINDVENEFYLFHTLKEKFDAYIQNQTFFSERSSYFLDWDQFYPKYRHRILNNMVTCPSGTFEMGNDSDHLTDVWWRWVKPKHQVKILQPFLIGEYLVTQALWSKVMTTNTSISQNHSKFKGSPMLPVDNVHLIDCFVFCNQLSKLEGLKPCFEFEWSDLPFIKSVKWIKNANGYRLPTEAEWEYAAKAGGNFKYSGSDEIDEVAWYNENSNLQTHEVGLKKANAWGIYDMSGNVCEWCMDEFYPTSYQDQGRSENPVVFDPNFDHHMKHVLRGGSYQDRDVLCLVETRGGASIFDQQPFRGFRLARGSLV